MRDEHSVARENKSLSERGAGPPRPAIAGSISMGSKGVNVLAEAANALVPTLLLLLLLLRLLLLQQSHPVRTRAWADAPPPPHPSFHPSIHPGSRGPYSVPSPGPNTGHLTHSPRGRERLSPFLLPRMGAAGGGFHRRKVQKAQAQNPGERLSWRQHDLGCWERASQRRQGVGSGAQVAPPPFLPLPSPDPPLSGEGRVWLLRAGKEGLRGI